MKILLYLDYKAFNVVPDLLIKKLKDTKNNIAGFEVKIDMNDGNEIGYLKRLAYLCKENDYILQVYSNIDDENKIKTYVDVYNDIQKIYDKTLSVVSDPISGVNVYIAQEKTNIFFSKILNYIYTSNYKINLSIKNLNSIKDEVRLSKKYLTPILSNNQDLDFTYDIGYEILEYGEIIDLKEIFIERLTNIHIHSSDYKISYKAILKNDVNKIKWVKAFNYLRQIDYEGNIVLQYDFELLGSNFEERISNYIEASAFIYQYIGV